MSDPTEMVLTCTFVAAVLCFVVGAAVKILCAADRRTPAAEPDGTPPPLPPAGRVAVWIYRPTDLLGAALVFAVFSGLVLASVRAGAEKELRLDAGSLLVNIAFQFVMAGIVTLTVVGRIQPVSWLGLRWSQWPWVLLWAPGAVFFMWLFSAALYFAGYHQWMVSLGVETTQETVRLLRETTDPWTLGLMAFTAIIAAPICEELVFRGYLYPLLKKYGGITAATLCTSLVFAAAHGNLTAILPLFVFGVVLVLLYEKTGSLWAPIAAHFCFNAATVGAQFAVRYYDIPVGLIP